VFLVVSYDVPDNRRRTRIANVCEDFGVRVQKSVFECILSERELATMCGRLLAAYDESEDSIRIYRFCQACEGRIQVYGVGDVTQDEEVFVV